MAEAIAEALREGRIDPGEVSYVNAHGSGTKQNDRHETAAFKASLGARAYQVPVSSIKSMIGHSLGAIGAIELVACVLAIQHGVVPPTANLEHPDPECDLDYVPCEAREHRVDVALSVGSGFGGFQSAMVLARPDWRR
jgi:3-oxoacyl-(acyl-carrier-protein) synthase